MTIQDFFVWLANSGGSIICVSWLLERWQWYQDKSPDMKRNLFFGFSCLVTVLAYCVLTYVPADILKTIAPFFSMIYVCFTTIYLGSKFHAETKGDKILKYRNVPSEELTEEMKKQHDEFLNNILMKF